MSLRYIIIGPNGSLPWTVAPSPAGAIELFFPGRPGLREFAVREGYRVDPLE